MTNYQTVDVFFQYFAEDAEQRDRSVVVGVVQVACLRNGHNVRERLVSSLLPEIHVTLPEAITGVIVNPLRVKNPPPEDAV